MAFLRARFKTRRRRFPRARSELIIIKILLLNNYLCTTVKFRDKMMKRFLLNTLIEINFIHERFIQNSICSNI